MSDPWPPAFCIPPSLPVSQPPTLPLSLSSSDLAKAQLQVAFLIACLPHPSPLLVWCRPTVCWRFPPSGEKVAHRRVWKVRTAARPREGETEKQRTEGLIGINRLIPTFDPPHTTASYAPLHMVKYAATSIITNMWTCFTMIWPTSVKFHCYLFCEVS